MTLQRRALIALVILALIWGFNWIVMKIAVAYAAPFTFAAWRTLGGGVALLLFALMTRKSLKPQKPIAFAAIGFFQTAGFVGLVTWAVVSSGAGQVAMLAYTMPFFVAILGAIFLHERMTVVQGAAIALAFAGVAAMIGPLHSSFFSDALAIGAGLSWAIGIIIAKRTHSDDIDTFQVTLWQMLFGGVALTVVAVLVPGQPTQWTGAYVAALAYNIVLSTALAYVLWIFILRVLPARDASMGTLANPIVGVLGAWLFLGERPNVITGAGMIAVVAGLAILTAGGAKEKSEAT